MIEVAEDCSMAEALLSGKAKQFYWLGADANIRKYVAKEAGAIPHDVWMTERQDDTIVCVVPSGTDEGSLPKFALAWLARRWWQP
jgi:hypothetical protein